jgi:hypothetical protein
MRADVARWVRLLVAALLVVLVPACDGNPKIAEVYPCEPNTSDANSSIRVLVNDAANAKVEGARVLLDPYGQEKVTNKFGGVCFGNLRVRGEDECVITSLTVTKQGFGTYRSTNIRLGRTTQFSMSVDLRPTPVNNARRKRPSDAGCATSP